MDKYGWDDPVTYSVREIAPGRWQVVDSDDFGYGHIYANRDTAERHLAEVEAKESVRLVKWTLSGKKQA